MSHIISNDECERIYGSAKCPFPNCPEDGDCLICPTHCPCCSGPQDGLCKSCREPECDNRNEQYAD